MRNTSRTAIALIALLVLAAAAGCGMRPPKDFHEAAEVEGVDLEPIPDVPAAEPGDAGVDADGGAKGPPEDSELAELPVAIGLTAVPALTVADLLGKSRADVESLLDPIGPDDPENPEGWIRYSDHLKLLFSDDLVSELIQEVPEGKTCVAAARWLGFADAEEPVESDGSCKWPAGDDAHALGKGVAGELPQKTGLFHARTAK